MPTPAPFLAALVSPLVAPSGGIAGGLAATQPAEQPPPAAAAPPDSPIDQALSLVGALPAEAHAIMAVALVAGLALWLFGGKLLKPIAAVLGLAAGGLAGLVLLPAVGLQEVGGVRAGVVGLGIGAIIGLVFMLLLLRVAIVFASGAVFAVAGLLGGMIYLQQTAPPPPPDPAVTARETALPAVRERLMEIRSLLPAQSRTTAEAAGVPAEDLDRVEAVAERIRLVFLGAWEVVSGEWERLDGRGRIVVLGSLFGGLGFGLLLGYALPKRSSALVTALLGSAVWLTAAAWLLDAVFPGRFDNLIVHPPRTWGIIWAFFALLGLVAQLAMGGRKRPAKARDE